MKKIRLELDKPLKTKTIWFRMSEADYDKIKKISKKKKVKMSVLMRAFTKELLKRI